MQNKKKYPYLRECTHHFFRLCTWQWHRNVKTFYRMKISECWENLSYNIIETQTIWTLFCRWHFQIKISFYKDYLNLMEIARNSVPKGPIKHVANCELDHWNKSQWNLNKNTNIFRQESDLKRSSVIWPPSCLGLNVLTSYLLPTFVLRSITWSTYYSLSGFLHCPTLWDLISLRAACCHSPSNWSRRQQRKNNNVARDKTQLLRTTICWCLRINLSW